MATYPQFVHLKNMTREQIEEMMGSVHVFDYKAAGNSDYAEKIQHWLKVKP